MNSREKCATTLSTDGKGERERDRHTERRIGSQKDVTKRDLIKSKQT
jgi:hypothetical protein